MIEKIIRVASGIAQKYFFILAAGILAIAAFNFFYHLDAERVWDWDEAREGVTAYEMIQSHNFVVSTFNHQTDLWNLKPPLGAWLIALDYKIFGFNVFALRFYSAVSCFLSVVAVMWIMARVEGRLPALISGFILTTTSPIIFIHGARSGDYSPLLTLLSILFIICLYEMGKKPLLICLAGLVFALAFLLYSFAAFQLMILALVFWGITGEYQKFPIKYYLGFLFSAFLPVAAWACWRLFNTDGGAFLSGMVSYDLLKRSTQAIEGHVGNFDYYFVSLATGDPYWFLFMATVMISYLASIGFKVNFKNRLFTLTVLGVVVPVLLFSLAKTKLGWYTIPIYPSFALVTGFLTWMLLNDRRCQTAGKAAILIVFLVAGLRAEREIQKSVKRPEQETAQNLLNDFKKMDYSPNSVIYKKGWTQAPLFVSEVVCGLTPATVKDLKECLNHQGFLMLEKDKKNTVGEDFVASHQLRVILQNEDWMIVKL